MTEYLNMFWTQNWLTKFMRRDFYGTDTLLFEDSPLGIASIDTMKTCKTSTLTIVLLVLHFRLLSSGYVSQSYLRLNSAASSPWLTCNRLSEPICYLYGEEAGSSLPAASSSLSASELPACSSVVVVSS